MTYHLNTRENNLADCLDLYTAYQRSLALARKYHMRHPVQLAYIKKYEVAAADAFAEAVTYIPSDLLKELKPALGARWKFRLLTWRWRSIAIDEEIERLDELHDRWGGKDNYLYNQF
jgi:hypothetical protein